MLSFEWDKEKARRNVRKHGVTFAEAASVFFDENATQFWDCEHSEGERRYVMLGLSSRLRALVVIHTERAEGETIRIISARRATSKELRYYGANKQ